MSATVRVWDLPTRVFHWSLVACIAGLVASSQIGGNAMAWHFRFGYAVASLLMFRLVWGVVGGRWSRFSSFVYSPASILAYLQGERNPEHTTGHNPLGAGSVFAMLGFVVLQVASGLVSDDEIAAAGPLVRFVSNTLVSNATFYHRQIGKLILLGLVALHLGAIAFYRLKKGENLVRPMIHGDKEVVTQTRSSRDDVSSRLLALLIWLSCAAVVAWSIRQMA